MKYSFILQISSWMEAITNTIWKGGQRIWENTKKISKEEIDFGKNCLSKKNKLIYKCFHKKTSNYL